ncbi:uncharacterized protein LOC129874587 isoform X2 [Solanum dulcamara]|uniref:uncharacterized protein LOC129874587 isoform X2 n=1 Tax=Solanum dulcamara TaxID=45834 RepID=UPI0024863E68|nr:uncharacterized protein LOC129874587 isoform X2 [Solanum dulcamara]
MEDVGLDTTLRERERERERERNTETTSSQPQDSEQMLRRAKGPPNKVKKKRYRRNEEEIKLMPAADDGDVGGLILLYDQSEVLLLPNKENVVSAWTKEDEITILNGLINFKSTDKSKKLDYAALYDSIKQSLRFKSATQVHLQKKVKCLREKYKNNLKRGLFSHEEELFYLSDKIWGEVNKDHEMNQQFTFQSSTTTYQSLDPEASDKFFVGDLGLALTTITRNQSDPVQVALQQYKLVSQSLSIRKSYANQILEARITPTKELSELEEQKITRSYFDTKIQHTRLVSDAYNARHGFENSLINIATHCVLKEDTPKAMNEGNCPPATIGCRKPITGKPSDTSPKSVSEMCHSQERKKKKRRKIENQEKHSDSSIQSQLEMENQLAVASSKDINESATSSQIHTLPDGLTVEVLVKGKADGEVASPGKLVKVHFIAKLRDTGCTVGSTIGAAPHQFCLGYEKVLKGLNIGIEGMHVGEKRRLTIPPSLGHGSKVKPPILPDSWLLYEVELVDICE